MTASAEEQVEEYTVCVPYTVTKEQKVQVCKMVPRVVEDVISPCCNDALRQVVPPDVTGACAVSAPCRRKWLRLCRGGTRGAVRMLAHRPVHPVAANKFAICSGKAPAVRYT